MILNFNIIQVVFEMQPRDAGAQAGGGASKEEIVRMNELIYFDMILLIFLECNCLYPEKKYM